MTNKKLLPGVIAAKPPHLMSAKERGELVKKDKMFIDIGASNTEEAEAMGVRVGDAVVPDSKFSTITKTAFKDGKKAGKTTLAMGKAFDNRACLFVVAEVVRRLAQEKIRHPNSVVGAATSVAEGPHPTKSAKSVMMVVQKRVFFTMTASLSESITLHGHRKSHSVFLRV